WPCRRTAVDKSRQLSAFAERGSGRGAPVGGVSEYARISCGRIVGSEIARRKRLHGLVMNQSLTECRVRPVTEIMLMNKLQRLADNRGRLQLFAAVYILTDIANVERVTCGR